MKKQRNATRSAAAPVLRSFLAMVAVLSFVVYLAPQHTVRAEGLTIQKTTAQPNAPDGDGILGGIPTRITWEAKVDEGEEISQISLSFPTGTTLGEGANTKATVLDGLKRLEAVQDNTINNEGATVSFAEPVASGLLVRVEMFYVSLPPEDGQYTLTGSYTTAEGKELALAESPAIEVMSITTVEAITQWLDEQQWVEGWNSVFFLKTFFNPQYVVASVPNLFIGWLRSLGLVLVGFPLAIPIGLGVAFLRMARLRIVRFVASIYVNVIRGTPLFLQMYIAFFGLPTLGFSVDSYLMGIFVLAMNSSAYLAEIFRAGIQSIPKGQFEASSSLGMNALQTMFSVIIPQTVRRVIPTATSEFILLYKDTSLLAAVGVMEQMMFAKSMVASTGNLTPYVVAACYYLLVTLPLTKIIAVFEKKLAAADGTSSEPPAKKKRKRHLAKERGSADAKVLLPGHVVSSPSSGKAAIVSGELSGKHAGELSSPLQGSPQDGAPSSRKQGKEGKEGGVL